jgi:hypothetical protein
MALASTFSRTAPFKGPTQAWVFRPYSSLIPLPLVLRTLQCLDVENVDWVLDGDPDHVYDITLCEKNEDTE